VASITIGMNETRIPQDLVRINHLKSVKRYTGLLTSPIVSRNTPHDALLIFGPELWGNRERALRSVNL
jgi:hypothetical protein